MDVNVSVANVDVMVLVSGTGQELRSGYDRVIIQMLLRLSQSFDR